jgi:hypothetical protein
LLPLAVSVKAAPPAVALLGDSEVSEGAVTGGWRALCNYEFQTWLSGLSIRCARADQRLSSRCSRFEARTTRCVLRLLIAGLGEFRKSWMPGQACPEPVEAARHDVKVGWALCAHRAAHSCPSPSWSPSAPKPVV